MFFVTKGYSYYSLKVTIKKHQGQQRISTLLRSSFDSRTALSFVQLLRFKPSSRGHCRAGGLINDHRLTFLARFTVAQPMGHYFLFLWVRS